MEEILLQYLKTEILTSQAAEDLSSEDDLLSSGLVDSMSLMRMVSFIEKKFELKIPPEDLIIEHFSSVDCIADYLRGRGLSN